MRQEYLFLDDTQKEKVEGYQYKNVKKTVQSYSANSFWEVIFEQTGESEKIAQTLSALHSDFTAKFSPIVLTDESSAYYNKKLYPKFNLFERELRKLLYLKRAQLKDSDVDKAINDLEKMDFGTMFIVLFTDKDFCNQCNQVKNHFDGRNYSREQVLTYINSLEEKILWDKLFSETTFLTVRQHFTTIREYRNDVMHAHAMNTQRYSTILTLMNSAIQEIGTEIRKVHSEISNVTISATEEEQKQAEEKVQRQLEYWQELKDGVMELSIPLINPDPVGKVGQEFGIPVSEAIASMVRTSTNEELKGLAAKGIFPLQSERLVEMVSNYTKMAMGQVPRDLYKTMLGAGAYLSSQGSLSNVDPDTLKKIAEASSSVQKIMAEVTNKE